MSYIGTEPKDIRSFGRTKFDYTATQGQTAFTGADDDGKVLAFTVGQIEVYVNGILMDDSDFTTTGTGTVTLATAANLNDVINIVSFETNIPDSNYVPATGGTFSGDVDFGANKITYANVYAQLSDLPSASTYHGMFAHVHATGLAYYAHAGAWIPLAKGLGIDDNADATAITIDSSENVLVGQTTASSNTVGTSFRPDGRNFFCADGNYSAQFNRKTSDGAIVNFAKNDNVVGSIKVADGDNLVISSTASNHAGLKFNNTAMAGYVNGASSDNTMDVGTSAVRFKDLYLGGGAYLGGTGASNKLEDYEEGTWTPTISGGGSFSIQNATYTKIGKLVYAGFYANNTTGITSTGQLLISLPFAVSPGNMYHGSGAVSYVGNANWGQYGVSGITPYSGNALMYFHKLNGSASAVSNAEFQIISGKPFICGLVYQTNA